MSSEVLSSAKVSDLNVRGFEPLIAPHTVAAKMPPTREALQTVMQTRETIRAALAGKDSRLVVIVGPCSIHDPASALEYAQRLADLSRQIIDRMVIVMRVYFEKPRTTIGWKGLINDPNLDGSCDIREGLRRARQLLLDINALGLPCATEFLDPVVPQYLADLVCWAAIGARTTESQTHRELASGLSMPVGFKNATDGSLEVAQEAIIAARSPHAFLGVSPEGGSCIVRTTGNPDVHLVLRGGGGRSNYSKAHIAYAKALLESLPLARPVLVDCSHANSGKNHERQPAVFNEVLGYVRGGEKSVLGMMLESNLVAGRQDLSPSREFVYGQSITDACISWGTTEELLFNAYRSLA